MHESPGGTAVHRIGEADELASRGDRGECLNPRQPNRAHGAGRISDATPKRKDARRVLWIATNDYCGSCDTTRVIPTSSQDPPATRYSARRCSIRGDCIDIFRHMMKCVIKAARPKPPKCAWCGKRFAPKPVGRPALFCSANCRQRATKNGDCPSTLRRMRSRGPVTASRAAEGGRGGSPRAHARTDYERHGRRNVKMLAAYSGLRPMITAARATPPEDPHFLSGPSAERNTERAARLPVRFR